MKKVGLVGLVIMLGLFVTLKASAQERGGEPAEFSGIVVGVAYVTAIVEDIDYEKRMVTLKNQEGNIIATLKVGPEARNFEQAQVGDTVNIEYSELVKIVVSDTAVTPVRADSVIVKRAAKGEKPAGVISGTTQVYATIEEIDYVNRTATLKGPQRTVTVKVDERAENFKRAKKGNTVYLEYTEALAISVTE